MTTITRELAELRSFITGLLSDPAHGNQSSRSMTAEVFRIALASLEAEAVAWISERNLKNLGKSYSVYVKHEPVMVRPIPLYTAPPAPVSVPDEIEPTVEAIKRVLPTSNIVSRFKGVDNGLADRVFFRSVYLFRSDNDLGVKN